MMQNNGLMQAGVGWSDGGRRAGIRVGAYILGVMLPQSRSTHGN